MDTATTLSSVPNDVSEKLDIYETCLWITIFVSTSICSVLLNEWSNPLAKSVYNSWRRKIGSKVLFPPYVMSILGIPLEGFLIASCASYHQFCKRETCNHLFFFVLLIIHYQKKFTKSFFLY